MMVTLKKPSGILLSSYLIVSSFVFASVQGQGMSGMMSLLGRLRGGGGGGGLGGRLGGGNKHGGDDGLAALLATGLLAKLLSHKQSNCYHQESRDNSFSLVHQRNALLQQHNALYQLRYAQFLPRFAHFQPRFSHFDPSPLSLQPRPAVPLQPRPAVPLQPRAVQLQRYANQARLAYLRHKQLSFSPFQSQAESQRIPFVHSLLHGFF